MSEQFSNLIDIDKTWANLLRDQDFEKPTSFTDSNCFFDESQNLFDNSSIQPFSNSLNIRLDDIFDKSFNNIGSQSFNAFTFNHNVKNHHRQINTCTIGNILPYACEIISMSKDPNYTQKLEDFLKTATYGQLSTIWRSIEDHFYSLSTHKCACRFIQSLIKADSSLVKASIKKLTGHQIFHLIMCQNGNHVMQLIVNSLNFDDIYFIYEELLLMVDLLVLASKDQCASRVLEIALKKLFSTCKISLSSNETERIKAISLADRFLKTLSMFSKSLMKDKYGNFIVKVLVINACPELMKAQKPYYNVVCKNLIAYSMDQFGSRVVEHILDYAHPNVVQHIYDKFVCHLNNDKDLVKKFMEHGIGNYVLQKILTVGEGMIFGNKNSLIIKEMKKVGHIINKFSNTGNLSKWIS
uniref:PUM-HD domain-containing protein n=2 Tax=Parastrongyloides trichosuri TaxID=131310 RepID=A0A0N4ZCX2_PARTI